MFSQAAKGVRGMGVAAQPDPDSYGRLYQTQLDASLFPLSISLGRRQRAYAKRCASSRFCSSEKRRKFECRPCHLAVTAEQVPRFPELRGVKLKKKAPTPLQSRPKFASLDRVRRASISMQLVFSRSDVQHKIAFRPRAVNCDPPLAQKRKAPIGSRPKLVAPSSGWRLPERREVDA